jgi:glutamine amidotransferase
MIQIVNYGVGNFTAVANMLDRIGAKCEIIADPTKIVYDDFSKLIFPGVGSFDAAMSLITSNGWVDPLNKFILNPNNKLLGICLGMQLLFEKSEEGILSGMNWIPGKVIKFNASDINIRIPHMGWNNVEFKENTTLFTDIPIPARFYFAHSYHISDIQEDNILATCTYGYSFPCAVKRNNIYGVQFHPEKSHKFGLKLLENFNRL